MTKFLMLVGMMISFSGCTGQQRPVVVNQSDTEKVENLINFSLVDSDTLQDYIKTQNDDSTLLEMIADYNKVNDKLQFSNNSGKAIKDESLQRRTLLLSNNL